MCKIAVSVKCLIIYKLTIKILGLISTVIKLMSDFRVWVTSYANFYICAQ